MVARELIPAAAYLRRSTDRQEQSLADQRAAIHEWASRHGYRIAFEFVDDAISGTSAKGRSGFQSMIAAAEQRRFQAVIVWNSDRFSRGDVTETEHYRYVLRQSEVTLLSVTEDFLAREGLEGDVLRTIRQAPVRAEKLRYQPSDPKTPKEPSAFPEKTCCAWPSSPTISPACWINPFGYSSLAPTTPVPGLCAQRTISVSQPASVISVSLFKNRSKLPRASPAAKLLNSE